MNWYDSIAPRQIKKAALTFILLMGVVSLFSDMVHEGGRSIYGAYLGLAGASAATIGFVTGIGELIGYSFRLLTGYVADKSRSYWSLCIIGYVINMLSIPLIALNSEDGWKYACALIILERVGKAIRQPSKNTLVSFAANQVGEGKTFAIQEFLDQIGAFTGPILLFVTMLFVKSNHLFTAYRIGFAILIIPAFFTLYFLLKAKRKFPRPEMFETTVDENKKMNFDKTFIIYIVAISLFAFGFIDFPIITMHVAKQSVIPENYLPLLYALAMLIDAFAALLWGWLYDRYGIKILMFSMFLSAFFAVFIFAFHSLSFIVVGVILWGIGMGAQESILKSTVASLVPKKNRSTGFGVFETSFGVWWFLGSWLLGYLYDVSINWMILVSVCIQLLAIPLIYMLPNKKG